MKTQAVTTFFLILMLLCSAVNAEEHEKTDNYFGARFKEGKGVEVSEESKKILHIETVEAVEKGDSTIIPTSALLKTVTGNFVYVVNGKHYLRTEVKGSPIDNKNLSITDGLFPGDEVVVSRVNSLWYAELQALRGGKACADGH